MKRSKTCQPIMRNALMQVVHDIQMLTNNVTLHEEGKKYPMPIIKKPRLFRKASLQVLRRRYQRTLSLSLSLSLSVCGQAWKTPEKEKSIYGNDKAWTWLFILWFYSEVVFGARSVHAVSWYPCTFYSSSKEIKLFFNAEFSRKISIWNVKKINKLWQ